MGSKWCGYVFIFVLLGLFTNLFQLGLRGYGLKTTRPYAPGELIIEYCGDVISPIEMQRRIETHYSKSKNHYFLSLENGCVIDSGLRGSAARFANHSCNPNSEMQKWYVHGIPRIGLFASDSIPTGTELTYDYNFDWFDGAKMQACLCGAPNCRGYIGKRSSRRPTPDELPLQDYRQFFSIPKQKRKKKKKGTKRVRDGQKAEPPIPSTPKNENGKKIVLKIKSANPESVKNCVGKETSNSPKSDTRKESFKPEQGSKLKIGQNVSTEDKSHSENEPKRITRSRRRKLSDSVIIHDDSDDDKTPSTVSSRILRRQSGAPSAKRRKVLSVSKPNQQAALKTAEPVKGKTVEPKKGLASKATDSQKRKKTVSKPVTKSQDPEPLPSKPVNVDLDTIKPISEPATETPKTVRHYPLIAKAPAQPPIVSATRPAHFSARPKNIASKPALLAKPQHAVVTIAPKLVKAQKTSELNSKHTQASDANRKGEANVKQATTLANQKLQNESARRNSTVDVAKDSEVSTMLTVSQEPQEDTQPSVSHFNLGQIQPDSCQSRKPSVSNILNPESSPLQNSIEPNLIKTQSRQHNLPSNSPPTDRAIHFGSPLSADSYSSGYSEPRSFQQHSPNVFQPRPQQIERRKSLVFDVTDPNKYHLSRKLSTYDTSWRRDFQHDPQSNQYSSNSKPVEKVSRNIELPVPPLLSRLQQNQLEQERQLGRQDEYLQTSLQPAHPQAAQPFAVMQGNMKPQEFSSLPTSLPKINKRETFTVPSQGSPLVFPVFDSSSQLYRSIARNHILDPRPFENQSLHLPRASRQQMSSYESAPLGTQPDQSPHCEASQQPKSRLSISSLTSLEEHESVLDTSSKPGSSNVATLTDLRKARRGRPALASKTVMVNTKTTTPSVGVKPKRGRPKASNAPGKQLPIPKIPNMVTACEPGKKVIEESNMRARGEDVSVQETQEHIDMNSDDERTKQHSDLSQPCLNSSGRFSPDSLSETNTPLDLTKKSLGKPKSSGVKPRRGRPPNSGPAQRLTLAPLASRPPTIKSNDGLASSSSSSSSSILGVKPPAIAQRISSQPGSAQGIRKDGTVSTRANPVTRTEFGPSVPPTFSAKPQGSCKSAFVTSVLNTPSPPALSPIKPGLDTSKRTMQSGIPSPKNVSSKQVPPKKSPGIPVLRQNEPVVPRKRGRPRSKGSSLNAGPRAFANIAPNIAPSIAPNIAPAMASNWARPLAPLRRSGPDLFGRPVSGSPNKVDHDDGKLASNTTGRQADAKTERGGAVLSKGKQAK